MDKQRKVEGVYRNNHGTQHFLFTTGDEDRRQSLETKLFEPGVVIIGAGATYTEQEVKELLIDLGHKSILHFTSTEKYLLHIVDTATRHGIIL